MLSIAQIEPLLRASVPSPSHEVPQVVEKSADNLYGVLLLKSRDAMTITNNINNIGNLYRYSQSYGHTRQLQHENQNPLSGRPVDRVSLSSEALTLNGNGVASRGPTDQELSTEEKQVVDDLKLRDAEVKAHEAAHMSAGGGIVQGGASYEYQSGPDGKMYAVGGEVQIDVSSEGTPEATIRKMQQIRRAALAPAQPSGTDRSVAAQASQVEAQARMEKTQEAQQDADATSSYAAQFEPTHLQTPHNSHVAGIDLMV